MRKLEVVAVLLVFASVAVVIGVAAALAPPTQAARRPASEAVVIARVPARTSAAAKELARLRSQHVGDLPAALALARRWIEVSRADGDPRPLGYAEAALLPFADAAPSSAALLVLRATIAQSRHQFERALVDLERALALQPADAQALLTQAAVLTVLARYPEARAACQALEERAQGVVALSCGAAIDMVTGQSERARAMLTRALPSTSSASERAWLLSLRCEAEYWLASAQAEATCRSALQLDEGDRYTRALLSDVLLDAGQSGEVLALIRGHESDDALLLRAALAAQQAKRPDAELRARAIRARLAQNRLRGDTLHQREEARLLLATAPEEKEHALTLARQNFAVQREPWDARLLLEAALMARDRAAAQPALTWLAQSGCESPRLRVLAEQLEVLP